MPRGLRSHGGASKDQGCSAHSPKQWLLQRHEIQILTFTCISSASIEMPQNR